jgi:hypothetical protein
MTDTTAKLTISAKQKTILDALAASKGISIDELIERLIQPIADLPNDDIGATREFMTWRETLSESVPLMVAAIATLAATVIYFVYFAPHVRQP